jgi:signal transduction histidine kinase
VLGVGRHQAFSHLHHSFCLAGAVTIPAMTVEPAAQRGRGLVWAARCLWGLVVVALLVHAIPGLGFSSGANGGGGGLSQLFVLVSVVLFLLAFATVGALVASRVPSNPVGWMLLGAALAYTLATTATGLPVPGPGGLPWYVAAADLAGQPLFLAGLVLGFLTLLLFPTGSLLSRRWRWAGWLLGLGWLLSTVGQTFGPARLPDFDAANPAAVAGPIGRALGTLQGGGQVLAIAGGAAACISLIVRFRRSESAVRKQIEWLAYAAVVVLAGVLVSLPLQWLPPTGSVTNYQNGIVSLAFAGIPVAMGIAILTRRLYDIDVIVNKTLVYVSLAVFITAVYIALVVGIGQAVGERGRAGFGLSILATAVVAVAFQPVRERVQHLANRLVYGKRATPYEALSAFAGQLGATVPAEDLLPQLARVLADATGAGWTQVWLCANGRLRLAAASPPDSPSDAQRRREAIALPTAGLPAFPGATMAFEVSHAGELLGALALAKRPGEALAPVERRLAAQLAAQAGLVLRNAGLTGQLTERMAELRASRKRIVEAADAERRRLERNIHDGAQQQLVALSVMARLAETTVDSDKESARAMVVQAQADTVDALENLRDLARGIYPPLLADQGLAAAVEAQARRSPVPVVVAADGLGRYPQEAEAAVYFCALEALQNVAKYAGAAQATVRLSGPGGPGRSGDPAGVLEFSVSDDGAGFDPAASGYGTGLQGMADRLAALGGDLQVRSQPGQGTTVTGRLPARALEPVP